LKKTVNNHEGIIRPKKTKRDPDIGPDMILAMIQPDLENLLKESGKNTLAHYGLGSFHLYWTKPSKENPLAIAGPFIGAPHAVIGMERAVALGARRFWAFGWCGSLQPSLKIGDLVLPTRALSEEGTSRHYPIGGRKPVADETMTGILEASLMEEGRTYRKGPVWTTDALYRETADKVTTYRDKGILAVEMEMSALMTLAVYRKVSIAGLLVVSDELFDLTWRPGFDHAERREASRFAGRQLLKVIETL
jgi:uridine phosphorylase